MIKQIEYAGQDRECIPSARQMMAAALNDPSFNLSEAERLAELRDFKVLPELRSLKEEMQNAGA